MYDLNQTSLVEKGLGESWAKPVFEILQCILQQLNNALYQELLIYDMPDLLYQDKVRIDAFLTKSETEEAAEE